MSTTDRQDRRGASMDLETYRERATPRLAEIDALDARCEWGKFDFQCSDLVLRLRERRERLMTQQAADEAAAGL